MKNSQQSLPSVVAAYGTRVNDYTAAVGRLEHIAREDLESVSSWAQGISGPVFDVGCGPGQWTHYLDTLGVEITGIDPVSQFIEQARSTYPTSQYRLGQANKLDVLCGELGGVLAWYSLIHCEPEQVDEALEEFARCIRTGGGLLLGFFTGPTLAGFNHAITLAYTWPVDVLSAKVENAGFMITNTQRRAIGPQREHCAIQAVRN